VITRNALVSLASVAERLTLFLFSFFFSFFFLVPLTQARVKL